MKRQIISILAMLAFWGCQSNRVEVKDLEIMAYYYHSDADGNWISDVELYASIDTTGLAQNLEQIDSVNYKGYQAQVDKKLVTQILHETRNKEESYYLIKGDTTFRGCLLGPLVRVKISYSDGKAFSFNFSEHKEDRNSRHYLFKLLYDQLSENNPINAIKGRQLDLIKQKQKEFASFAISKDTLNIWFPPPLFESKPQ